MAVRADVHGNRIGSTLLVHSEEWLHRRRVRFLQVKAVAATGESAEYAETENSRIDGLCVSRRIS
jgi:hypothetical protein